MNFLTANYSNYAKATQDGLDYMLITLINITAYAFSPMAKIIYKIYKISAVLAARRIRT